MNSLDNADWVEFAFGPFVVNSDSQTECRSSLSRLNSQIRVCRQHCGVSRSMSSLDVADDS